MMFQSSQFESSSPFSQSSQAADFTSPSGAKGRATQGLVPATVKQLSEAYQSGDEKSNFLIDGADITNVTLVGIVSAKETRFTDVNFSLDDGTGKIDCRRWVNEGYDSKEMEEIEDGMYVRIVGHLRSAQGAKQIAIFAVRPIKNFDEITFHFLDCIHQHLQKSKLKVQSDGSTQPQVAESTMSTPPSTKSNGFTTVPSNELSGQYNVGGLKSCDQKVHEYLQQNFSIEKGVHRDEIARQLKIPVDKIMESIRALEEEGLIYSTIDEYHYKSTTED